MANDALDHPSFVQRVHHAKALSHRDVGQRRGLLEKQVIQLVAPDHDTVGWLTRHWRKVGLGPYARWDNDYCYQEFGTRRTLIELNGQQFELDFETPARRYSRP